MITRHGFISTGSYLLPAGGHGWKPSSTGSSIRCAKKRDVPENSEIHQSDRAILPPLRVSSPVLARSALAVFGLGFIDAGYIHNPFPSLYLSLEIHRVVCACGSDEHRMAQVQWGLVEDRGDLERG